jgi:hypothetical protein
MTVERPAPRFQPSRHSRPVVVAEWQDAEELAVWHLREFLGVGDAKMTPPGADGGVDVRGDGVVAQVKFIGSAVTAPQVRQLVGAGLSARCVFYARQGYTAQAVSFADEADVALFTFTLYGDVTPVSAPATKWLTQVGEAAARQARPAWMEGEPWWRPLPGVELDRSLAARLDRERKARESGGALGFPDRR